MSASPATVVVTGGSSLIARYLLPRLVESGRRVIAISRRPRPEFVPPGVEWRQADIAADAPYGWWRSGSQLIHLAPVSLLANTLEQLARVDRVIAFSTTSVVVKAASSDADERAMAADLLAAESDVTMISQARAIPLAVLRPTLIYDGRNDKNIARLRRFVRRYGFLPVAGPARGMRQPVHADDLAGFCLRLLDMPRLPGLLTTSGSETLSYCEMVERVFDAEGRVPRIFHMPEAPLRLAASAASRVGLLRGVSPAFLDRMNDDLVFDNGEALSLGFRPRDFDPGSKQ